MLSALRRGASASSRLRANRFAAVSTSSLQRRTFLTSPGVTSYVMARAKVLHLAARSFLAYNQIITLDSATSPLSRYFVPSCTLRERVYMYLVSLIPPDQPIDLPNFLSGAEHAANVVLHEIYSGDEEAAQELKQVASQECVDKWMNKLQTQRKTLKLPADTTFQLEKLVVHDARLAAAEYEYSDAAEGQEHSTCSMYHMNEAVCMTVRFVVTEHLLASRNDGEQHPARHTLKTTFDWSFYSDVSRDRLVSWQITKATPFKVHLGGWKPTRNTKMPAPI
jgi:hypothetical protein